jgi:rsbT antagonist protein RsbS
MPGLTKIPIIKLHGNLIVSIQIALSDQLVMQLRDDITAEIERTSARGLVIDVSGIDVMDSYISRAIRDISLIARLMGVRTVISGMDAMIAMTLVEMGMDLKGVHTELNLEAALDLLDRHEDDDEDDDEEEDDWQD